MPDTLRETIPNIGFITGKSGFFIFPGYRNIRGARRDSIGPFKTESDAKVVLTTLIYWRSEIIKTTQAEIRQALGL